MEKEHTWGEVSPVVRGSSVLCKKNMYKLLEYLNKHKQQKNSSNVKRIKKAKAPLPISFFHQHSPEPQEVSLVDGPALFSAALKIYLTEDKKHN